MSDNTPLTDRILDLIDNGLQSSHEPACDAGSPDLCARCQCHEPAEGGDLCAGCRAWILEDSNEDPANLEPKGEISTVIIIDDLNDMPSSFSENLNRAAFQERMRSWWERRAERAAGLAQTSRDARARRFFDLERTRSLEAMVGAGPAAQAAMRADLQRRIETRRREDITRLHAEIRQMAAYYPARQSFPDILPDP